MSRSRRFGGLRRRRRTPSAMNSAPSASRALRISTTVDEIRKALEAEGAEFIADGVRRRRLNPPNRRDRDMSAPGKIALLDAQEGPRRPDLFGTYHDLHIASM